MELEKEHKSAMMIEKDAQAFKSKMQDHTNNIRKDCASYFEESMKNFHDLEKGQAENFLQSWQQDLRQELLEINSDENQSIAYRTLALTHLEYIRTNFKQNHDKRMNLPLLNKMYKTVMTPSEFNKKYLQSSHPDGNVYIPPWLWGDHIEVWAFAHKFKCTIKVIYVSKFGSIREDIVEGSDDNKDCNLLNRRSIVLVYSEAEKHYDMMEVETLHAGMKLDEKSDIFIPKDDDEYSEEETEVQKSDKLTPGEEDQREIAAKKAARAADAAARKAAAAETAEKRKAKAADKKAEEMKAKAEKEANAKKRADEKKARQIRETNMNQLLEKFRDECHKQNRLQQDFNKVYLSEVSLKKNYADIASGGVGSWQEEELYEKIMAKKESKFGEYSKFDDEKKEMATILHKWLRSNLDTNEREELIWDHFILIADSILWRQNTPYTGPSKDENAYEADKQAYIVKYSGDPTDTRKEDRKWLKRFYGILHGQNMVFHSNIASSVIEYVERIVPITGDKQQVDRGIELRRKMFQKLGLQSYPACLPEGFIRDHFKVWSQHAVDIAMSGKAYTVPKYLHDDHEAMAAFTALVNITVKHLRRSSRGDAGWVSRTLNGDGRPKTRFKKDPIRWGAQITTNNHFLVDPSVPAPVLNTALRGSRRWMISENVNW